MLVITQILLSVMIYDIRSISNVSNNMINALFISSFSIHIREIDLNLIQTSFRNNKVSHFEAKKKRKKKKTLNVDMLRKRMLKGLLPFLLHPISVNECEDWWDFLHQKLGVVRTHFVSKLLRVCDLKTEDQERMDYLAIHNRYCSSTMIFRDGWDHLKLNLPIHIHDTLWSISQISLYACKGIMRSYQILLPRIQILENWVQSFISC